MNDRIRKLEKELAEERAKERKKIRETAVANIRQEFKSIMDMLDSENFQEVEYPSATVYGVHSYSDFIVFFENRETKNNNRILISVSNTDGTQRLYIRHNPVGDVEVTFECDDYSESNCDVADVVEAAHKFILHIKEH